MFDYFDIHSHLNFPQFDVDREEVIENLKKENIATITVGTGLETSRQAILLAENHKNLFAAIGVHPAEKKEESFAANASAFAALAENHRVVAIGECGLDYFVPPKRGGGVYEISVEEKSRQKKEFETQIQFAVAHDLPLMIHCRDAYPDCLVILRSYQKEFGSKLRGNFHFFTSSVSVAKECLDIGFTLSFTGPITFVTNLEDVVAYVPLQSMMVETDSPFASPAPWRGKRNEPRYVKEIVKKIAAIKSLDIEVVKKQLVNNACELFLRKNSSPVLSNAI